MKNDVPKEYSANKGGLLSHIGIASSSACMHYPVSVIIFSPAL